MNYSIYKNNELIGRLPDNETDTVARFVAGIPFNEMAIYKIVDGFDVLILLTLGGFLDTVPDQRWLTSELVPLLLKYNNEEFEKVTLIEKPSHEDEFYRFVESLEE